MQILIWLLTLLTIQPVTAQTDNINKNTAFSEQTEIVLFDLPEEIILACGLKIEFDCDNLCRDSLCIPKNSMLMVQFSVPDKSDKYADYFESIVPNDYRSDSSGIDITPFCLSFMQKRLLLPEEIKFNNGRAELDYEMKIFKPEMIANGDNIELVPGSLVKQIKYRISFSQTEYDSLKDCGMN